MTPGADTPLVVLDGLRKSYNLGRPNEVEVLHGLALQVQPGEFIALIGPSGSGKSTLLNVLGLLEPPTAGRYRLLGQDTAGLDDAALTRLRGQALGFVFQFHHLLPAFTALENVTLPMLMRDGHISPEADARARALLRSMGLDAALHKKPGELSGGMQQRVAMARALASRPPLVLADEPTGNLDRQSADDVFALMRRLHHELGTAFVVVTHDPSIAARCDRVVELVDGRIVSDRAQAPA